MNSAKEVKNFNEGDIVYLNIEICDEENETIFIHFDTVFHFIDDIWGSDCKRV